MERICLRFPHNRIKAVMCLPVIDLLLTDDPSREISVCGPGRHTRLLLKDNPFVGINECEPSGRRCVHLDLSRAMHKGLGDRRPLYARALSAVRGLVRDSALEYFLSGDFPRESVWFSGEEYDYMSIISELAGDGYIVLAVDVSQLRGDWSVYRFADLVHRLVDYERRFVLISSNDDGTIAEMLSNLYRSRSLSISFNKNFRYAVALLARADVVFGTDVEQIAISAYLRNGSIGLVASKEESWRYRLWGEHNHIFRAESVNVADAVRLIKQILERKRSRMTRKEQTLWMGS